MSEPKRLHDVLDTFEREAHPKEPETTATPAVSAATEEDIHPALVDWMDAVTRLADLLDEETSAALIGDASKASDFTRRKAESEHEIRRHARRAEEAGVRIPASRREDAVAILTRLEEASTRNASCLGALREATSWIVNAVRRAAASASDEGMYSRKGKGVGPGDHSLTRLDTKI